MINPRGPYLYERFHDPSPITDGPEISWAWDAPAPLVDWCPTTTPGRAFSPRITELVREHLVPRDKVQWLPVTVAHCAVDTAM